LILNKKAVSEEISVVSYLYAHIAVCCDVWNVKLHRVVFNVTCTVINMMMYAVCEQKNGMH